ncbi:MAG: hypothetical protein ACE361_19915 [Aureliella sp.]
MVWFHEYALEFKNETLGAILRDALRAAELGYEIAAGDIEIVPAKVPQDD